MAITTQIIGTLGGGGAETIIIPASGSDQNVTLPAGTWVLNLTATNTGTSSNVSRTAIDGQELRFPTDSTTTISIVLAGGRTITIPKSSYLTYLPSFAIKIKP